MVKRDVFVNYGDILDLDYSFIVYVVIFVAESVADFVLVK